MSIAEKLTTIAENQQKVYEAGQKSEYDRFWDTFQNYGGEANYYNAFTYNKFTDENFNPKYDLISVAGVSPFQLSFYNAKNITDTKVAMISNTTNFSSTFGNCENLITIRRIVLNCDIEKATAMFTNCKALKNITIEGDGKIACDISIVQSPLTVNSMKSIISHLKNFKGTENELKYTVTFSSQCWTALEADSASPDGGTWREYVVSTLGWNA